MKVHTAGRVILTAPPSNGSNNADLQHLRQSDLLRFIKRAQRATGLKGEISLLLADDARLRELNRSFRQKNKSTDVLSFPAPENPEGIVGDLAISVEAAARQAVEHGHSLNEELKILLLHGVLHLAGMDHEHDGGNMRARESELRQELKLPAGLIERTQPQKAAELTRPQRPRKTSLPAGAGKA